MKKKIMLKLFIKYRFTVKIFQQKLIKIFKNIH